ncbi:hypothetical protein [uncultured Clostridium sp.]|uniref:hypothetical protein n=1 Tax=uncultured Clostridium sp. TaxID=59620 RepID=UPI002595444F|nr:hypothetical protein [uncultured Clostridium sp.]
MDIKEILTKLIGKTVRIIIRDKKNNIVLDYRFSNFPKGFVDVFSNYEYFNGFISCLTHTFIIELKEK